MESARPAAADEVAETTANANANANADPDERDPRPVALLTGGTGWLAKLFLQHLVDNPEPPFSKVLVLTRGSAARLPDSVVQPADVAKAKQATAANKAMPMQVLPFPNLQYERDAEGIYEGILKRHRPTVFLHLGACSSPALCEKMAPVDLEEANCPQAFLQTIVKYLVVDLNGGWMDARAEAERSAFLATLVGAEADEGARSPFTGRRRDCADHTVSAFDPGTGFFCTSRSRSPSRSPRLAADGGPKPKRSPPSAGAAAGAATAQAGARSSSSPRHRTGPSRQPRPPKPTPPPARPPPPPPSAQKTPVFFLFASTDMVYNGGGAAEEVVKRCPLGYCELKPGAADKTEPFLLHDEMELLSEVQKREVRADRLRAAVFEERKLDIIEGLHLQREQEVEERELETQTFLPPDEDFYARLHEPPPPPWVRYETGKADFSDATSRTRPGLPPKFAADFTDPRTGRGKFYYVNHDTGEVRYDHPLQKDFENFKKRKLLLQSGEGGEGDFAVAGRGEGPPTKPRRFQDDEGSLPSDEEEDRLFRPKHMQKFVPKTPEVVAPPEPEHDQDPQPTSTSVVTPLIEKKTAKGTQSFPINPGVSILDQAIPPPTQSFPNSAQKARAHARIAQADEPMAQIAKPFRPTPHSRNAHVRTSCSTAATLLDPPLPVNAYGRSKLKFENLLLQEYAKTEGLFQPIVLRLSNMLGPVDGSGKFLEFLVEKCLGSCRARAGGAAESSVEKVKLLSDCRRSFVFVGDVVRAMEELCRRFCRESCFLGGGAAVGARTSESSAGRVPGGRRSQLQRPDLPWRGAALKSLTDPLDPEAMASGGGADVDANRVDAVPASLLAEPPQLQEPWSPVFASAGGNSTKMDVQAGVSGKDYQLAVGDARLRARARGGSEVDQRAGAPEGEGGGPATSNNGKSLLQLRVPSLRELPSPGSPSSPRPGQASIFGLRQRVFNCGGPEPWTRVQLADLVKRKLMRDEFLELGGGGDGVEGSAGSRWQWESVTTGELNMGYPCPLDLTMNSGPLERLLGWVFADVDKVVEVLCRTVREREVLAGGGVVDGR